MEATANQREYWAEWDALFAAHKAEREVVQKEYRERLEPTKAECERLFRPRLTEIDDRFKAAEKALDNKYGVNEVER